MNERVKVVKVVKVAKVVKVKECEFFKFLKTFLVPSFCLTFRHFFLLVKDYFLIGTKHYLKGLIKCH